MQPGDTVIDATCGNGYDTRALAQLVGAGGTVHAFDVQQVALDSTLARLQAAGLHARFAEPLHGHDGSQNEYGAGCHLHLDSHVNLAKYVAPGSVSAVAFNLGYLPGQEHEIMTDVAGTEAALYAMMQVCARARANLLFAADAAISCGELVAASRRGRAAERSSTVLASAAF